jgi:hypothetical protein
MDTNGIQMADRGRHLMEDRDVIPDPDDGVSCPYLDPDCRCQETIPCRHEGPEAEPLPYVVSDGPIHAWFELTYAAYLVLPRSILQSMPLCWQGRFVALLREAGATYDAIPEDGQYHVSLRDEKGRTLHDPLRDYERGRRRIEPDRHTVR